MTHRNIVMNGDTAQLRMPDRFDTITSLDFRIPFVRFLLNNDARKLVIDLSDLNYIDSMGLGTLISWENLCKEKGRSMLLHKCNKKVQKIFRLAGVETLFAFAHAGSGAIH